MTLFEVLNKICSEVSRNVTVFLKTFFTKTIRLEVKLYWLTTIFNFDI